VLEFRAAKSIHNLILSREILWPGTVRRPARASVHCTKVRAVEHPFLTAMAPVAEALGARIVLPEEVTTLDIELRWEGQLVGALRLPKLQGALDRLIDQVEKELGGSLENLSREDKQRAVKLLDDRGAFELRRSVEDVADTFGVSRITIYNYLNATRR
jgi:HTH domain